MEIDPRRVETDKNALLTPEMSARTQELAQEFIKSPWAFYVGLMAVTSAAEFHDLAVKPDLLKIAGLTLACLKEMKAKKEGESDGAAEGIS